MIHVGSYEHHNCEIISLDEPFGSQEWWNKIQNADNKEWCFDSDFDTWKQNFRIIEAAGGLVSHNESVLMIFRNGIWDLPKGWIEPNEHSFQAALREVNEECGELNLTIQNMQPRITYHLYVLKGKVVLKETKWYSMSVSGDFTLKPQIKEGIHRVEFVHLTRLNELLENSFPMIRWIIDQEFNQTCQ